MAVTQKENPRLASLIRDLRAWAREGSAPVWRDIADRLAGPRRNWAEVNLSRIARYARANETVAVPGVVLASGSVSVPVTVGTVRASAGARRKIEAAGGQVLSLVDIARGNPKGSGVRILG